ncbi:DUF2777 domain-containing protein [Niallia taxi]|uniref:DUF2777 domain-containing protein n=1 Tax=Niallia taxi TaxID=2499688 RepID=A0A3S2XBW7_9BACI|nr:DUF2777 domain-containing protein [Niallia taxi]MCM3216036.1 DUF2777 domain-containing protein [Niallia taxi]MDK8639193.1 DUF2777 domain-containing protein [Niallia taxi]MED4036997.1 DUF2777 domain-containing protein [Niallia taxi]MED4053187.1 DUF2777 domain-containing protein [Niallia taxi]MED4119027.1 DUF2777 domain-containing protein [Niallia taxi]
MNNQQRLKLIEYQTRAFTQGTVEYISDQWIFFDDETEEATMLDEYIHQEVELFCFNKWRKGILLDEGRINSSGSVYGMCNEDKIRIRKHLVFSLERLLDEISDDSFYQFITTLNSMNFSIYDCIYCYNQLTFLRDDKRKNGVNMMIFDNQEGLCSVNHHFYYNEKITDRFEFTLNTGKRMIIEKLSS